MAAPWFKIFPLEILGKPETSQLTDDQIGKLLRLWALASLEGCSIPSDPIAIGKLLRMQKPNQMVNQMVWLSQFFRPTDDPSKLVSTRLLKELQAYEDKCSKLRANGCLGGAPKRTKQEPNGYPNAQPNENQMAPEGEREEEVEKEKRITPTPSAALQGPGVVETRKKREPKPKAKPSWQTAFTPEVLVLLDEVKQLWPSLAAGAVQPFANGQPVPIISWPQTADRLCEIIKEGADTEILLAIGKRAVREWREGKWIKAPQHFFGKSEDAPWRAYYKAEVTNRAKREEDGLANAS